MKPNWNFLWQDYAESASLNPAQKYRRKQIARLLDLDEFTKEAAVLDAGSGQGDQIHDLNHRYPSAHFLGLDISESGIRVSREKAPAANFICMDLGQQMVPPPEFQNWATHVICSELLEHVENPIQVLRNLHPFLKPGCRIVVTVPGGPMSAFDIYIGHRRHYNRRQLKQLLEKAGFRNCQVMTSGFPFFNLYRLTVIGRGQRLIQDVSTQQKDGSLPRMVRFVMGIFSILFTLNAPRYLPGWQLIAVANFEARD